MNGVKTVPLPAWNAGARFCAQACHNPRTWESAGEHDSRSRKGSPRRCGAGGRGRAAGDELSLSRRSSRAARERPSRTISRDSKLTRPGRLARLAPEAGHVLAPVDLLRVQHVVAAALCRLAVYPASPTEPLARKEMSAQDAA